MEFMEKKYQKQLEEIKIFKQFPQLLPFVGKYYENNNKKLLLIGESHYMPKKSIINLHISYLPWNKGAYPNVWSFIDETP